MGKSRRSHTSPGVRRSVMDSFNAWKSVMGTTVSPLAATLVNWGEYR